MSRTAPSGEALMLPVNPSILRRLAAMLYEALLVAALLMVAGFLFIGAATHRLHGPLLWSFQLYLCIVLGAYFVWCWHRGGRTLAMRAWRLRLQRADGAPVELRRALMRFVLAGASIGSTLIGIGLLWKHSTGREAWLLMVPGSATIIWALFDRDGQFLHDRLVGTRLVLEQRIKGKAKREV